MEKEENVTVTEAQNSPEKKGGPKDEPFRPCMTYSIRMAYEAGYDHMKPWPCEGKTVHAGVGWFHPFGRSEYYAILGDCPERKDYPIEKYFTPDWMDTYDTALFCIYRMKDGDIYAYDGIFCQRGAGDEGVPDDTLECRRDILTNVIVGGTGRYEGIRGLMLGTAEGSGDSKLMDEEMGMTLPKCLLKCLEGYAKIPTD